VDWKSLKYIGLGALFTLPLGTLALVVVPANYMRIFISAVIICLCAGLLKKKIKFKSKDRLTTTSVGMISGFLSGVAAIGGPPVILFYFSSDKSVSVSRASMITFFLLVDILALFSSACYGLLNLQILNLSFGLLIPLSAGVWIGNLLYGKIKNTVAFRKQIIFLLMTIALISLVKFSFAT